MTFRYIRILKGTHAHLIATQRSQKNPHFCEAIHHNVSRLLSFSWDISMRYVVAYHVGNRVNRPGFQAINLNVISNEMGNAVMLLQEASPRSEAK